MSLDRPTETEEDVSGTCSQASDVFLNLDEWVGYN